MASDGTTRVQGDIECCNAECGWRGFVDAAKWLRGDHREPVEAGIGPLCPECGEVTEPRPVSQPESAG